VITITLDFAFLCAVFFSRIIPAYKLSCVRVNL